MVESFKAAVELRPEVEKFIIYESGLRSFKEYFY